MSVAASCPMGLSPRVRGNQNSNIDAYIQERSIPACAGEPQSGHVFRKLKTVYPRVCGGTDSFNIAHIVPDGLSPRVRGNRLAWANRSKVPRSIPACAGEPAEYADHQRSGEVYPRVCGGTPKNKPALLTLTGLSPRVRGNQEFGPLDLVRHRSIPACAGEPADSAAVSTILAVYPRVCGGTYDSVDDCEALLGLSPRVRGNRVPPPAVMSLDRSIPACAGEPSLPSSYSPFSWVYPRVCGGTLARIAFADIRDGLSPRVRGNPLQLRQGENRHRSIPACAGEPGST